MMVDDDDDDVMLSSRMPLHPKSIHVLLMVYVEIFFSPAPSFPAPEVLKVIRSTKYNIMRYVCVLSNLVIMKNATKCCILLRIFLLGSPQEKCQKRQCILAMFLTSFENVELSYVKATQ